MKYENGKIYKIESDQTDKVYIGSTTEKLSQRMAKHRCNYKKYNEGKYCFVTSFDIIKFGDAKIYLIENFPCNSKEELQSRERHYIKTTECVNKNQPGRTDKEYREDNKEILKEKKKAYVEANKEAIKQKGSDYYQKHKDIIKDKVKDYRQKNKDIIKEKKRNYYQANKDKINSKNVQRVVCDCGREVAQKSLSVHKTSKLHIDAMAKIN